MNTGLLRNSLAIIIILSLAISSITPIVFGYDLRTIDNETLVKTYNYNRYSLPESYDCYNMDKLPDSKKNICREYPDNDNSKSEEVFNPVWATQLLNAPIDSAWPMFGHDTKHTGRSSYSTVDTWERIWAFETYGWADSSPAIDKDGIIYIGSYRFYAVYPNGTLRWERNIGGSIESCCPAIGENGIIYVGTAHAGNYLCALYSTNGTIKWKHSAGGAVIASPAIDADGVIYFAAGGGYPPTGHISALYPNGTLKWSYPTNHVMYSSPAIGNDGTVYCGSHDNNVYALYPNNGTLNWKFTTGSWVHGSPTVADDGTIYIGSDDGYLYAIYPNNGTMKWKCNVGCIRASPTLDEDGTIYVGVWEKAFYAIYPNSTIKWIFYPGAKIWGSSAALSADGTIYFGTCDLEDTGGIEIIALYTDGTVKWRKELDTVFSSPAIGSDGTVYIGENAVDYGYLHAFGTGELKADTNGPYYGLINNPVQFEGSTKGGHSPHSYHWDFGDNQYSDEQNPIHTYTNPGNYEVVLTVTDKEGDTATDTTHAWIQTTNNPPNKPTINGPTNGKTGTSYPYTFTADDPDESVIWYYIDWGDNTYENWIGPYSSGEQVTISHTWYKQDTYTIQVRAKDPYNAESEWSELEITMPRNRAVYNTLFYYLFEKFPILARLLNLR